MSIVCQLCDRKIGTFRRLVDREYCSAEHRLEARTCLDRTLADIDDSGDEGWAVVRSRRGTRSNSPSAQTASVLLLVVAAVLILATLSFSGGATTSFAFSAPSTRPATTGSGWTDRFSDTVGRTLRSRTSATLRDDFRTGLTDWVSSTSSSIRTEFGSGDWSYTPEGLKPGRLRIWKRSTELSNYELDFVGQIDRKSMSWAYRALDSGNYYGTKLTILKSGPGPNAGLVRYVMLNGRELDRVQLPLPISIAAGEPYRVRVKVSGDHFMTSVNGQVISAWSDQRIHRGGVGFFSEEGESSTLKWVSLSERDSLLGKVVAYFSLFRMPLYEE